MQGVLVLPWEQPKTWIVGSHELQHASVDRAEHAVAAQGSNLGVEVEVSAIELGGLRRPIHRAQARSIGPSATPTVAALRRADDDGRLEEITHLERFGDLVL